MQVILIEHYKNVAIETIFIDIHSNSEFVSIRDIYIYVSWKCHEDSLNILWVTLKNVKRFSCQAFVDKWCWTWGKPNHWCMNIDFYVKTFWCPKFYFNWYLIYMFMWVLMRYSSRYRGITSHSDTKMNTAWSSKCNVILCHHHASCIIMHHAKWHYDVTS